MRHGGFPVFADALERIAERGHDDRAEHIVGAAHTELKVGL
ncbi:hypothetical protein SDC9_161695 [bioreactor metagenome]|uniref:Uncharacterized protein n=1 Tax=bioreactor metagenome TaxID=1076179 RepID=A0A645FIZ3_9ZZZZ